MFYSNFCMTFALLCPVSYTSLLSECKIDSRSKPLKVNFSVKSENIFENLRTSLSKLCQGLPILTRSIGLRDNYKQLLSHRNEIQGRYLNCLTLVKTKHFLQKFFSSSSTFTLNWLTNKQPEYQYATDTQANIGPLYNSENPLFGVFFNNKI